MGCFSKASLRQISKAVGRKKLEQGQSIFVGNIKGGVGKSTLTTLLFDYFQKKKGKTKVQMVDADRQGTSFELLEPMAKGDNIRHVPASDRFGS